MTESTDLKDKFRDLRTALEAIPEAREPPKPTLRILGAPRAEDYWNRFLKYLLDPTQPHGFEADLLKAFLDKIEQKTSVDIGYLHRDIDQAQVEREVSSEERNRPDILIRSPGEWFVCIECKVDASETNGQLTRYLRDPYIGDELKAEYPETGHHYVYLSKESAPNAETGVQMTEATAPDSFTEKYFAEEQTSDEYRHEFVDLCWRDVVEAFSSELQLSRGQYPNRSVSQLDDFHSTINTVINMREDDFTETRKEKIQLLGEYRSEIEELFEAADALRDPLVYDGEWVERFRQVAPDCEVWSDEWHCRPDRWGTIFREGWYLDNDWNITTDDEATRGGPGHRLHFMHYIREERSFRDGELKFTLECPTNNGIRDEFNDLYSSSKWQREIDRICAEQDILNRGRQKTYTEKVYDVELTGLPESYFETLATAFEEHQELARAITQIQEKAVEKAEYPDN